MKAVRKPRGATSAGRGGAKQPKANEATPVVRPGSVQERVWQAYHQLRAKGEVSMTALAGRLAMAEKNVQANLAPLRKKGLAIVISRTRAVAATVDSAPAARKDAAPPRKVASALPAPVAGNATLAGESEAAIIDRHLREKGVTKCPPAYVAPVEGARPVGPLPHQEHVSWMTQRDRDKARRAQARAVPVS